MTQNALLCYLSFLLFLLTSSQTVLGPGSHLISDLAPDSSQEVFHYIVDELDYKPG